MERKPPGREGDAVRDLLKDIRQRMQVFSQVVMDRFGKDSQTAYRTEELLSALQRLEWEIERQDSSGEAATSG